ncbi:MAG: cupin [Elusimicrobia bacterium CG11_big_fil_rev_8_21_14_0_20_64_6]|nr:MAG: cupin [Elusimicrobia bacterium CG11_big_fil_rev_8_21_14_0_20_64_6]
MLSLELVEQYGLEPHPEGGFYKETYRSSETMTTRGGAQRPVSTGILFLLPAGEKSRLHRIKSDELWHFHLGGALRLTSISPEGKVASVVLGPDIKAGQLLQHVVPARHWFGAEPAPGSAFSLVGCTVAPGFDFDDFDLGSRATLLTRFPDAREVVLKLTDK